MASRQPGANSLVDATIPSGGFGLRITAVQEVWVEAFAIHPTGFLQDPVNGSCGPKDDSGIAGAQPVCVQVCTDTGPKGQVVRAKSQVMDVAAFIKRHPFNALSTQEHAVLIQHQKKAVKVRAGIVVIDK
jgi:hypothetical protein